jgi:choline kinase
VGEYIPLMKFNAEASSFLFTELEKCNFEGPITLNRVFERCFQVKTMNYIEVKGHPWVEIDTYNDLQKARKLYAEGFRPLTMDAAEKTQDGK